MPPRKRKAAAAAVDGEDKPAKRATRSRKKKVDVDETPVEPEPAPVQPESQPESEPEAQQLQTEQEAADAPPAPVPEPEPVETAVEAGEEPTTAEPEPAMPAAVGDLVQDEEERDTLAAMGPVDERMDQVAGTEDAPKEDKQYWGEEAMAGEDEDQEMDDAEPEGAQEGVDAGSSQPLTMEERMEKLRLLRGKMRESLQANRKDLVAEHARQQTSARELQRLERKRKLAEVLREKADAEERGEDPERKKNWEYSIEENEEWEKKLARKKKRADFSFNNDEDHARRRYKKDLDYLKPDLEAYNRQKEAALGLAPGTLIAGKPAASTALVASSSSGTMSVAQRAAAEDLYRDANSLIYADNKPTEDAIDRVVSKLNIDLDRRAKFSRKRLNEDEGDVTYINERNRVFNKKIARYYDKYTAEIRASFERGTAL